MSLLFFLNAQLRSAHVHFGNPDTVIDYFRGKIQSCLCKTRSSRDDPVDIATLLKSDASSVCVHKSLSYRARSQESVPDDSFKCSSWRGLKQESQSYDRPAGRMHESEWVGKGKYPSFLFPSPDLPRGGQILNEMLHPFLFAGK